MTNPMLKIGQYIILRRLICRELLMASKIGSNKLYLSLENLNRSVMNDLINRPYESDELTCEENILKVFKI